MYDTKGVVEIISCNFISNTVTNMNMSGGGGLYIEFTICIPGFTKYHSGHIEKSSYNIHNCNFFFYYAYSSHQVHNFSQQVFAPTLGKGGGDVH